MAAEPVIIDAATFLRSPITITAESVEIEGKTIAPGRGWLRRLAPEGWTQRISAAGTEGVSRSAAVSALASIARDDRFTWLTELDALGGAENKPYQYRRAAAAGVPVPEWIVTTDTGAVPQEGDWVAKPLGPGAFVDEQGNGRVVPTKLVDTTDRTVIAQVPFILQRLVDSRTHARVVTIGSTVRSAKLPAASLPLDWRTSSAGHYGFIADSAPDHVHELAQAAAASTNVNYSSQDWIEDSEGQWWFIDLNPAGQWLFLPEDVASPITHAIARHLDGF
ncbi:hypothetical protein [Aeromicrobium panaciterrae]|uniref:hypothetical protein n=1 Tax=Aeromicrobium panaciterrae TaxID=363861 RepID=UPI0031CFE9A4